MGFQFLALTAVSLLVGGCHSLSAGRAAHPSLHFERRSLQAVYVTFGADSSFYEKRDNVDLAAQALARDGFDTVFLSLRARDAAALAHGAQPFTGALSYFLGALSAKGIQACAAILSDELTGASFQTDVLSEVDDLSAFNRARAGSAAFHCVVTDYEIHGENRSSMVYERWHAVHAAIKSRLMGQAIELFAYTNDLASLMAHGGLEPSSDGPVVDAVIPMYYSSFVETIRERALSDLRALRERPHGPALIAGLNVAGGDSSLRSRSDYKKALETAESLGLENSRFLGTATFAWVAHTQSLHINN